MKIAVVYNRDSRSVINLFGVPSREKYGLKNIKRIVESLRKGKHQVISLEGDKDLIRNLEEFMPQVLKGERPGMVFNLSYGIQGQARYTHVPGMLEMLGVPYVGSGPLAHSLSLDKVVAKMLFRQHDLPTPDFAVLEAPGFDLPEMAFPMIVKPKNESTSFGLEVVHDEEELRRAAQNIFDEFGQAVLVEAYIDGREINVGLIGNDPVEAFAPAELIFAEGPPVYTLADKRGTSGREVTPVCPADIPPELAEEAQALSVRAFRALGCSDCARVDIRISPENKLYLLEINSLPSLGAHGSYPKAALNAGLDFPALINRLVDEASARYFGTPHPPSLTTRSSAPEERLFAFLTERREQIERRLNQWTQLSSRTGDAIGLRRAFQTMDQQLVEIGLHPRTPYGEQHQAALWESDAGLDDGTLLLLHLDVPLGLEDVGAGFRREPEWLYGEGIGCSRAPLVSAQFALRALKSQGLLKRARVGVLAYGDEGRDCARSAFLIREAAARAAQVLVLKAGSAVGKLVTGRRGLRRYQLTVEDEPRRLGKAFKRPDAVTRLCEAIGRLTALNDRKARLALGATDLRSKAFAGLLPHRASCTLLVSAPSAQAASSIEGKIREQLEPLAPRAALELVSERPAMSEHAGNTRLAQQLIELARPWEVELGPETSQEASAAGLITPPKPVVCGLGPVTLDPLTPQERVLRISLVRRGLVLSQFLASRTKEQSS